MKPPSSDVREPSSAAVATPPSGKKVIIKSADMLPEIQKEAIDTAIFAFEKHSVEKDVVEHIKTEFDVSSAETLSYAYQGQGASTCFKNIINDFLYSTSKKIIGL
ncbi:dynein light chain [Fagus crenata]